MHDSLIYIGAIVAPTTTRFRWYFDRLRKHCTHIKSNYKSTHFILGIGIGINFYFSKLRQLGVLNVVEKWSRRIHLQRIQENCKFFLKKTIPTNFKDIEVKKIILLGVIRPGSQNEDQDKNEDQNNEKTM